MRKPGIEITTNWVFKHSEVPYEALGLFILLAMKAIENEGTLPNDNDDLLKYAGTDNMEHLMVAKSLFEDKGTYLEIPDTLNYKVASGVVRKPKYKRAPIDMSIYDAGQIASFNKFTAWIEKNTPRVGQMQNPFAIDEYLKLTAEGWDVHSVTEVLTDMQNWKPLLQKNTSAFLTVVKWLNRNLNGTYKKIGQTTGTTTKMGTQVDIHQQVKESINGDS